MPHDTIHIEQLALEANIGVPDVERAQPQRLVFSITLGPQNDFSGLDDNLERTVDYAAVAEVVKTFVAARAVKLIETLADETAMHLLAQFPIREVSVEVRKFVVPGTQHVAVRVTRSAAAR
jgi:dihydroneopterin aldolase